ncbi:hypothetical protein ERO13_D02G146500v2 [Gossypium hirsutum]|uniref:Uncharacterized protein n=5 Tax=Gossypium TaxID=3633 RepID=A0A5J5SDR4_GOSBA|nr:hypothetical protein ES319_D02G168100v1 [Gossypium barbadense]KAG4158923.1 hypothetical protein ERO13_D02G146500v2 [Gossypium hirsutum]KJB30827.1 hypothetical protein B456_005G164000 [Gossypium raimondii]TYG79992.1 hypothetical protein ES288_D02G181600v1 [Gossypium darwinii]TYH84254.1 hypothetical protein ES332_D02G185600v1 [Gossypium tomentosum]TYI94005.1 hypothetical protein E1A91_D02G174200v1 [Gossypium mustelinum]
MIDPRPIEMCYALVILWFSCGSQKLVNCCHTLACSGHVDCTNEQRQRDSPTQRLFWHTKNKHFF